MTSSMARGTTSPQKKNSNDVKKGAGKGDTKNNETENQTLSTSHSTNEGNNDDIFQLNRYLTPK